MKKEKIFFFDLDGTLLNKEKKITDKTMEAVYSSEIVKNEINKQASQSFASKKGRGKKK